MAMRTDKKGKPTKQSTKLAELDLLDKVRMYPG